MAFELGEVRRGFFAFATNAPQFAIGFCLARSVPLEAVDRQQEVIAFPQLRCQAVEFDFGAIDLLKESCSGLLIEHLDLAQALTLALEQPLPDGDLLEGPLSKIRVDLGGRQALEQCGSFLGVGLQELGKLALRQQHAAQKSLVIQTDQFLDLRVRLGKAARQGASILVADFTGWRLGFAAGFSSRPTSLPDRMVDRAVDLKLNFCRRLARVAAHDALRVGSGFLNELRFLRRIVRILMTSPRECLVRPFPPDG